MNSVGAFSNNSVIGHAPLFLSTGSRARSISIIKPLVERAYLFDGVGREQVIDGDIGRGDENGLGVREGIEAVLAVVVPNTRGTHSSVGHRLDEQEDIGLVYCAAAE